MNANRRPHHIQESKVPIKDYVWPQVRYGGVDDEALPLTKCVCGAAYPAWELVLYTEPDEAVSMPCCGRRLYFSNVITVHEIAE